MNNHLAIPVKNLEESKKFYQKLGFEVFNQWEKPKQELKALWMSDESGYKIELIHHSTNQNLEFPKITEVLHLGIAVTNLEEKIKEFQEDGVKIVVPITKGITVKQFAFIKDPNGFSVELVEY
jgi:catechol 2,3-dioxygenase-like lactoylglutathione lyase family enzyme